MNNNLFGNINIVLFAFVQAKIDNKIQDELHIASVRTSSQGLPERLNFIVKRVARTNSDLEEVD